MALLARNGFRRLLAIALLYAGMLGAGQVHQSAQLHQYRQDFALPLEQVPFSRYGSYLTFQQVVSTSERPAGLYLRSMQGALQEREIFRLELIDRGQALPYRAEATPTSLHLWRNLHACTEPHRHSRPPYHAALGEHTR